MTGLQFYSHGKCAGSGPEPERGNLGLVWILLKYELVDDEAVRKPSFC